jgi:hypothetical protein
MVSFQNILNAGIREPMHVNCLPFVCGKSTVAMLITCDKIILFVTHYQCVNSCTETNCCVGPVAFDL